MFAPILTILAPNKNIDDGFVFGCVFALFDRSRNHILHPLHLLFIDCSHDNETLTLKINKPSFFQWEFQKPNAVILMVINRWCHFFKQILFV